MKDLTQGKPLKLILLFAIPLFIGQLFQLFYGLVDIRIVGQTLGESSLAAVGATTTLSDLMVGLLNGLTNGFAIIIATFFGAKDEKNMKKAIAGTALLGGGCAIIISILSLLFLPLILNLLHISEDIMPQAMEYISIILAGLIVSTLYNVCAAILRAMGDSFTPLLFLIISSFLNIGLDYAFILLLHTGVGGAALATVLSQGVSALLCFIYMKKKYPSLRLCKEDFSIGRNVLKKLLETGISMAFMTSLVQFGTLALQTSINTFGNATIVAHTAARKLTSIFFLPTSVLGTTLATYCGQNLGAGKYSRIKKGIKQTVLLNMGWWIITLVIIHTILPLFIQLITATTDPEVVNTAVLYLKVNSPFYFVTIIICLFRNSMQGFGDSKTPVFSSSLELIGKVLIATFLSPVIGYWGIIVSEPIVWFVMVIPLIVNMIRNPIFKMEDVAGATK